MIMIATFVRKKVVNYTIGYSVKIYSGRPMFSSIILQFAYFCDEQTELFGNMQIVLIFV